MAEPVSAQDRLDRIVRVIAAEIVAEVCSVYVMRAGEVLELFATVGLRPEAVHRTRLRVGEGLVGESRRRPAVWRWPTPSRTPTSPTARRPAKRSTTRSWACRSCAAAGCVGVLVVQNRAPRDYAEDEIETLQTIASIVAELLPRAS